MIKFKIHTYITENNNKIANEILFHALDKKQRMLLISAMKTGKTTFIMKYLSDILKSSGIQLIFVTPVKSLMNDISSKYKIIKCNGNVKEIKLNNNTPVLTTPESMHKVISTCEEENKDFFIVYDEMHQVVTNADFRKALYEALEYYNKELCIGLLGMTATPEPLENINFDKTFEIVVENKFIQADKTLIVKNFTKNADNMFNFIKYMKKINNNRLMIARINNRDTIKLIKDKLSNCMAWYRTSNEKKESDDYIKDMQSLDDVLTGKDLKGVDYLLCTSLIDVGVEIQLEEKPIVIDFLDNTSTVIDDIQFVGRFRQGIKELYLVGKLNKEKSSTKPLNLFKECFIKEYNERLEVNKNTVIALNNYIGKEQTTTHLKSESINFNETDLVYELNEYGLMQSVFKRCINLYLERDIHLKYFLEKHSTFNSNEIQIIDYNNLNIDKNKKLEEEKKKIKKDIKNHEKEFYNEINSLSINNDILKMILNYEDVEQNNLWKIKSYQYLCNIWKDDYLVKYKERYKQVSEILKNAKINEIDILKIALEAKKISELKKQINFIQYNILYGENKELKPLNKDMLIVYKIREYINKTKEKERDVYLSDKFKLELLEQLKKEKSLSKLSPKQLDKHLKLIYSISKNNKTDKIKSIKIKLN